CLADRLRELDTLASELARADRTVVAQAFGAASSLTPVASCENIAALAALPPRPADSARRVQVEALRADIARAQILLRVSKESEARGILVPWLAVAPALGHAPSITELLVLYARLLFFANDAMRARALLEGAELVADWARDDRGRAQALSELAFISGASAG